MEIKIDIRKTDSHYYDKELNQVADNNEIIKLTNNDGSSPFNVAIDVIAAGLNLNEQERNVLYLINYYNENNNVYYILNKYKENFHRSRTTFCRCLDVLIKKRVIKVNNVNIVLDKKYSINNNSSAKCKYLIIELSPNITSKEITI